MLKSGQFQTVTKAIAHAVVKLMTKRTEKTCFKSPTRWVLMGLFKKFNLNLSYKVLCWIIWDFTCFPTHTLSKHLQIRTIRCFNV